jgi:tetratricopeptide (TPR) repeat protein
MPRNTSCAEFGGPELGQGHNMMRVARPTTITDRTLNRLLMIVGLLLLFGVAAFALFYLNDRKVGGAPSLADQAVAAAEAQVQKTPNDVEARVHLAAVYVSDNREQDGITQFGEALKIDPAYRAALLGRGIAYIKTSQLDLAQADFEKFIAGNSTGEFAAQDPQLEQAYYELGLVQLKKGDPATAADTLQNALKMNGTDADALYSLGVAFDSLGRQSDAVQVLKLAASFVPTGWCDPYQELATAYTGLKQADGTAWANGMVALCNKQYDQAVAALAPLINGPMKVDALMGLGYAGAERGDNGTAAKYFTQVLAIDPQNQSAIIALNSLTDVHASGVPGISSPSAAPSAGVSPAPKASN